MFSLSRRGFLRAGAATALSSARPRGQSSLSHDSSRRDGLVTRVPSDDMRTLALRAVDVARAAGAVYADVRLTRTVRQMLHHSFTAVVRSRIQDEDDLGFGVRALVNGSWGFSASPYWDPEEAVHLAKQAVSTAKANALGFPRVVEWEPIPAATGTWISPGIDPFSISVEEKVDFINTWRQAINDPFLPSYALDLNTTLLQFVRQEWFMASTEGAAIAQTFYRTGGLSKFYAMHRNGIHAQREGRLELEADGLEAQRGGWDIVLDAKLRDQIPGLVERAAQQKALGVRPVDIGRYDVVFDAQTSGALIGNTFGMATQLDRALGLEANAEGTSYLGPDPLAYLGSTLVGAPLLNVTANRSMPKGNATVRWDDEGVLPDEFPLVEDGLLVDYQTTREQAPWIKAWYDKQRRPVRSHGCAASESALYAPVQQTPNLVLHPGTTAASFETLVANTKKGYAFMNGRVFTDMQVKNGKGWGDVREIVNGKLGDVILGAGLLFNTTEFWKNVTALGDSTTVRQWNMGGSRKGEPQQNAGFSVQSVPIAVKNVSIIDAIRRA